jgi:formylglycine-generating enzyme required for sulfatase activity
MQLGLLLWQLTPREDRPVGPSGLVEQGLRKDDPRPPSAKQPSNKDERDPKKPGPGELPRRAAEIKNTLGMRLVLIPKGKFRMGSPEADPKRFDDEDEHEVEITRPFYLGKYEVTRGEFAAFVKATQYQTDAERDGKGGWGHDCQGKPKQAPEFTWRNPGFEQTDQHPVVNVSWNDAMAFCAWLSEQEGAAYRLPTEAEWEYACRAGTTTRYHSGDDPETLVRVANVADASARRRFPNWDTIKSDDRYGFTAPAGQFKANRLGLHDMHGNVWEWCQDWYHAHYYKNSPAQDPQGPAAGIYRVHRGGSWASGSAVCRTARRATTALDRTGYIGFRVVLAP